MMQVEVGEEEEGEEEEVEVVEVLGEAAVGRPAPDVNPWLSLPQRQGQRRGGQAVFHERHETP